MGILTRAFERRAHPSNKVNWALYGLASPHTSYTGKDITEENALDSTAFFNGVRIISETIASLPLHLYQRMPGGGKKKADSMSEYDLLHTQPNSEMTAMAFREAMGVNLCTWGNFYAEKEIDGANRLTGLWPLLSKDMEVKRVNGELVYAYLLPDGGYKLFKRDKVLHVVGFSPNGLAGYNIVKKAQEAIALGLALEEYAARYFGNGARPSAVMEHPQTMSVEAQGRFRDAWNNMHEGLSRSHRVAILEEGMKLHEWGSNPEEAQAIEARKFQVVEVARILNIPVHLLKDLDRATNNNIEHQSLEFVTFCLRPWLVRIEQTYNTQILTEKQRKKYFYEHLIDGLLRGDASTRHETYAKGRQWGYYSANDIREMENKNPIDGGDVYYMPFNMMNLEDAGKQPLKQSNPTEPPEGEEKNAENFEKRSVDYTERAINNIKRIEKTHYRLFEDAAQRIVNKEVKAVTNAVKKYLGERNATQFNDWSDSFYLTMGEYIRGIVSPVDFALAEAVQAEVAGVVGSEVGLSDKLTDFINKYIIRYGDRHIRKSAGQIKSIIENSSKEELADNLLKRMGEWNEKRAEKIAHDETVRLSNAVAHEQYRLSGVTKLIWKTRGANCPFCNYLSGKVVGIDKPFLDDGSVIYVGPDGKGEIKSQEDMELREKGWQALKSFGAKFHAPIHLGCDCIVAPVME
ncbi:MAG: phage portal protein [Magnetococcus sp. WYHC-3]